MNKRKILTISEKLKDRYQKLYLESQQNFMTLQGFIDWYGIPKPTGRRILSIGAAVHKERTGKDVDAIDKIYLS
tara:strand:+ start:79 stop:300 length:222 start_codon:yes stop_codon:yes gene_type:complete